MRVSLSLLLAMAALLALCLSSQPCDAQPLEERFDVALDEESVHSRVRREGNVGVDVEKERGGHHRVTIDGKGNVWKSDDQKRRVDVHGSADNRGNRRAGGSFSW